jgi:predicted transposase/invertase (TIGR01784 family)
MERKPLSPRYDTENREFHHNFVKYDKRTNITYPDSSEIHVLEVQKAKGAEESPLVNWLRFFAAETTEEFAMIAQTRPAIAEAWGVVQYLSGDEEARRLAEYEEMARRDEADRQKGAYKQGRQEGLQEGLQEGEQKGLQKGKLEGKLEVARNLLQEELPIELVVKSTGLSLDEVQRLAADFNAYP